MRDSSRPSPWASVRRTHGLFEPRVDPTVVVKRLDPAAFAPATSTPRCVRCGRAIDADPVATPFGAWHEECRPIPAPDEPPVVRLERRRNRTTHLTARDRDRVLTWLAENGPATGRMVAWALNVHPREVTLLLRSLEGARVESAGVLLTGRRGHPPTLWRIREAIAA